MKLPIKIFTIIFFQLTYTSSYSQGILIDWIRLQGSNVFDESAYDIMQTSDGGFVYYATIMGSNTGDVSGVNGSEEGWLVKTDGNGAITWQHPLGGSLSDWGRSVLQTNDGGYLVAGKALSLDGDVTTSIGDDDVWVVKLDANGAIQWDVSMGGTAEDVAHEIKQTSDGGYVLAGGTRSSNGDLTGNNGLSDFWFVKLDANGNIQWQKNLGGSGFDEGRSVIETSTGDFVIVGLTYSNDLDVTSNQGQSDFWAVKLNTSGTIVWEQTYGGSGFDECFSIIETSDNGYVLAGGSDSQDGDITNPKGDNDFWLVKIDANGTILWEESYGGTDYDYASEVVESATGQLSVIGSTYSSDGDVSVNNGAFDIWVIRTTATGVLLLEKSIGGTQDDFGVSINELTNGKLIIGGGADSNDGDVSGNHGMRDILIAQLRVVVLGLEEETLNNTIYPNPSDGNFTIDISDHTDFGEYQLKNIQGKVIETIKINQSKLDVSLDLPPGEYFLSTVHCCVSKSVKIIIE